MIEWALQHREELLEDWRLASQGAPLNRIAPLRDHEYFARVRVSPDLGAISWPSDADWDPLVLYSLVTGRPIDALLAEPGSASA